MWSMEHSSGDSGCSLHLASDSTSDPAMTAFQDLYLTLTSQGFFRVELTRIFSSPGFYTDRVVGRDRDHRDLDRFATPGRPEGS